MATNWQRSIQERAGWAEDGLLDFLQGLLLGHLDRVGVNPQGGGGVGVPQDPCGGPHVRPTGQQGGGHQVA